MLSKITRAKFALIEHGRKPGRGAYLCDDIVCLEKAMKSKRLEKAFEMKIAEEIYEDLRGVMIGEK